MRDLRPIDSSRWLTTWDNKRRRKESEIRANGTEMHTLVTLNQSVTGGPIKT